jgi:hypothetical protein
LNLVKMLLQVDHLLPARDSAIVPKEDEDHVALGPEVRERLHVPGVVGETQGAESGDIRTYGHRAPLRRGVIAVSVERFAI